MAVPWDLRMEAGRNLFQASTANNLRHTYTEVLITVGDRGLAGYLEGAFLVAHILHSSGGPIVETVHVLGGHPFRVVGENLRGIVKAISEALAGNGHPEFEHLKFLS
jgi:hypothetical protein